MAGLEAVTGISTSKKILVAVVLAAGVAAAWYFLFFVPAGDEMTDARQALDNVRQANEAAKQDYARYEQLTAELVSARQSSEQLHKQLPASRDLEDFMSRINTQAKQAGLRITNLVPLGEQSAEYYVKLPIKVEFRGTYHQVFRFFTLVDREIERPVNMENLTLVRAGTSEEPNLLRGTVRATTFMAKAAPAASSGRSRRRR